MKNEQEDSNMVHVTIGGITREYEEGTQLKTAAEEFQGQYENNILLSLGTGFAR